MGSVSSRRALSALVALALVVAGVSMARPAAAAPGDTFTVSPVSKLEGNAGPTSFVFEVTRSGPATALTGANLTYSTSNGTATAPSDFTAVTDAPLSFAAGQTEATVTIVVNGDAVAEPDETFTVVLEPGTVELGMCGDCTAVGTIRTEDPQLTVSNATADPEGAAANFTVTLAPAAAGEVTVEYETKPGTAVAPADYASQTGILTFAAGETTKPIAVTTVNDLLDESTEGFTVELSDVVGNATIKDGIGEGTIQDNDALPTVSVADDTATEGGAVEFVVTLSAVSGKTITVDYATSDGTAKAGDDYTAVSNTLTFLPGETEQTVSVATVDDIPDEVSPETFTLTLSDPSNVTIAGGNATGSITDGDAPPSLTISNPVAVTEPDTGTANAVFTVSISPASGQPITIDYATENDTATAGSDYNAASGPLVFAPGDTAKTITVQVRGDTTSESDEQFFVNLTPTDPTLVTVVDGRGEGTITENDPLPAASVADDTVLEDAGTASLVVELSRASASTVKINYATTDGTAVEPGDYTETSGQLVFAPGETSKSIPVPIVDDGTDEAAETFTVSISAPADANATIADGSATGTITDNDDGPEISITDVSATEGDSSTSDFVFAVTLSESSEQTVTAEWTTTNGSAVAPADYGADSDTVTFAPGSTSAAIFITVNGDTTIEATENFKVTLSAPANATISDAEATGTIQNDDAGTPPTLTIGDVTVAETDASQQMTFTVALSPTSTETVKVDWATQAGTATAGSDYTAATNTLTFTPGDNQETFSVTILGDDVREGTETFSVQLSNPQNAAIGDSTGAATINDDESEPTLSIADSTPVVEGDTGTTNATFTVTLSGASQSAVTVAYATANDTAKAPSDYTTTANTLTFTPGGALTQNISVPVVGDRRHEGTETFSVNLSSPSGATIADGVAIGTINDNESPPTISVSDASVEETDTGTANLTFTVTLSVDSDKAVTVDYETSDGTATAPGDYTAASDSITFAPGDTSETITITVNGDTVDEPDETMTLTLTDTSEGTFLDDEATGTIEDNDAQPSFSISDVLVDEGDDGEVDATFTVTLSGPSSAPLTVDVDTDDASAAAPGDYTSGATTLTFTPGDTSETFTVKVQADTVYEGNEAFDAVLSNASSGASISDATGTATITDDDPAPEFSVDDVTVPEGDSGTVNAVFTVTKTGATEVEATVDYQTSDETADAGDDYTATSATLTFAPGEDEKTITVEVNGDTTDEVDETYAVELSDAVEATIADGSGTGTITDDDVVTPTVSVSDASAQEGGVLTFTVSLSWAYVDDIEVDYETLDDDAEAGADYEEAAGTLVIPAGQTSKTLTVGTIEDTADEPNETFVVELVGSDIADPGDTEGTGTIVDDDEPGADPDPGPEPEAEQRYVLVDGGGTVYPFNATHRGDLRDFALNAPVIGLTMTPSGNGYWLVAEDGGIFSFGDAQFFGSMGSARLNAPVLGMEATPTGNGYWLFAEDGGIFSFGDAQFFGSTGNTRLNAPMVGMEATGLGSGYWLVAQDGGIFAFGDAPFHGSTGSMALNEPVFDMAAVGDGSGYWLVARDGGMFTFGALGFFGSAVGLTEAEVVGMAETPSGEGYWIADADGQVIEFGDAEWLGDAVDIALDEPIVGFAAVTS